MCTSPPIDPSLHRSVAWLLTWERRLARTSADMVHRVGGETAAAARHVAREAERRARHLEAWLPVTPPATPKGALGALVQALQGRFALRLLLRLHDDQIKRIHQVLERADGALYEMLMEKALLPCVRVRRHLAEQTSEPRFGASLAPSSWRRAP